MKIITKHLSLDEVHIKFDGDSKGIFEGYASVFGNVDSYGDIMLPGSYKSTLLSSQRPVAMFFNHDSYDMPVGKWLEIQEDSHGLYAKGELTPGLGRSSDLLAAMKHGTVGGLSVGFGAVKADWDMNEHGGKTFKNVTNLHEISIVTRPANTLAQVNSLKSLEEVKNIRDAENWLRESAGLSRTEAQAFIARVKSADRSESDGGDIEAITQRLNNFAANLRA